MSLACGTAELSLDTRSWMERGWNDGKARTVLAMLYACSFKLGAKSPVLETLTKLTPKQQQVVRDALKMLHVPQGSFVFSLMSIRYTSSWQFLKAEVPSENTREEWR